MRPKLHFLDRIPYRGFGPAEQGASGLVRLFFYSCFAHLATFYPVPGVPLNIAHSTETDRPMNRPPMVYKPAHKPVTTTFSPQSTIIDHNRRCYRPVGFSEAPLSSILPALSVDILTPVLKVELSPVASLACFFIPRCDSPGLLGLSLPGSTRFAGFARGESSTSMGDDLIGRNEDRKWSFRFIGLGLLHDEFSPLPA